MPSLPQNHSSRMGGFLTPTTMAWFAVGAIAMTYMVVVAVRPGFLANYLPERIPSDPQSNEGQRAMSKALAEVQSMRESVGQVHLDLAKVRTELSGSAEREQARDARLSQLEQKTDRIAGLAERASNMALTMSPTPPTTGLSTPGAPPGPKTVAAATDGKSTAAGLVTSPAPTPVQKSVETGTVATSKTAAPAEPITFGPATVKPTPVQIGIALAEGTSVDALRLSWSLIADKHAATLKKLQPRYTTGTAGPDGTSYALIAGPVKSEAEARKICKTLEASANPCRISTFEGDAL